MEQSEIIACVFLSDDDADAGLRSLVESGVSGESIRIGATDRGRAHALAAKTGVQPTLDVRDPLAGVASLADERATGAAIDRGGVIGGAIGLLIGAALGFTRFGAFAPVDPQTRPIADALLLFALGAISGASLGGALGPRRSTHVAYRIVDAIDDGGIGMAARVAQPVADASIRLLESAGAVDIIRVTSS
jgi:hypothetical protein